MNAQIEKLLAEDEARRADVASDMLGCQRDIELALEKKHGIKIAGKLPDLYFDGVIPESALVNEWLFLQTALEACAVEEEEEERPLDPVVDPPPQGWEEPEYNGRDERPFLLSGRSPFRCARRRLRSRTKKIA
jgi:hypothetical protein